MKRLAVLVGVVVLLSGLAASAEPINDAFAFHLDGKNLNPHIISGTGWNDNWIGHYVDAPDWPWWNTWFYNDPVQVGSATIDLTYFIEPDSTSPPPYVRIALNWSTAEYSTDPDHAAQPPLPDEEQFIERYEVFAGPVHQDISATIPTYNIPDFNPEWVSLDAYVYGEWEGIGAVIKGSIFHECFPSGGVVIPEPLSMAFMGSAFVGVVAWRARRRRRRDA